jgi:multidrug resistance efflux pump
VEESRNATPDVSAASVRAAPEPRRKRANILGVGLRILVAAAILAGAGYYSNTLVSDQPEPVQRQQRERSFTIAVIEPQMATFTPHIESFGQIVAGRSIDIRARASGEAVEVSPSLVAGGSVEAGEVLLRIDDFDYRNAVAEAEAALADARLALGDAEAQVSLQSIALNLAERQFESAQRDLERARTLLESGSVTNQEVETRELAVAEREQALEQARNILSVNNTSVARQEAAIESSARRLAEAERALVNTTVTAPFNGVVISESAEIGRVFSQNESVANLYDSDSLEVSFTLSDQQYGQLTSAGLIGRSVTVAWDIDPEPVILTGEIIRAGAEVDAALGGVDVFASMTGESRTPLRPGTFVEVLVDGLDYPGSLRIPETALYENNHFYTIREGRMARIETELLARDGDALIVRADVPEGERIIATHLAQAGEGVLVTVEGEEPMQVWGGRPQAGNAEGQGAQGERPQGQGDGAQRPENAPEGPPQGGTPGDGAGG